MDGRDGEGRMNGMKEERDERRWMDGWMDRREGLSKCMK